MHAVSYNFADKPAPDTAAVHDRAALPDHWEAVREAGVLIAEFGAIPEADIGDILARVPDFSKVANSYHAEAVRYAVSDIAAGLQPGLRALANLAEAGGDTTIPARALWVELACAHAQIVGLCERDS